MTLIPQKLIWERSQEEIQHYVLLIYDFQRWSAVFATLSHLYIRAMTLYFLCPIPLHYVYLQVCVWFSATVYVLGENGFQPMRMSLKIRGGEGAVTDVFQEVWDRLFYYIFIISSSDGSAYVLQASPLAFQLLCMVSGAMFMDRLVAHSRS